MKPKYQAYLDKKTRLWVVTDNGTGDIVAYIPNGKTRIPPALGECVHCLRANATVARKLAKAMNGTVSVRQPANACS